MYLHRLSVCIALGMKPEATRRPVAINTYPRGPLAWIHRSTWGSGDFGDVGWICRCRGRLWMVLGVADRLEIIDAVADRKSGHADARLMLRAGRSGRG